MNFKINIKDKAILTIIIDNDAELYMAVYDEKVIYHYDLDDLLIYLFVDLLPELLK